MARTSTRFSMTVVATLLLMTQAAHAHTGVGDASGFLHGLAHPIAGLDHILAMVAVGLFAAQRGGRALWLVPLAFVSMMAVGGALGLHGVSMPQVELAIAVSVIVLGAAVALRANLTVYAAMGLVGFFAIFHGHAHGAEIPADASGLNYAGGFLLATALLHGVGIAAGIAVSSLANGRFDRAIRVVGGAMSFAGVGILAGIF